MHLVAVAWMYVVLMMGIVEAMSANGTLLGAFFTVLLYGVLPLGIVLYVMGTPGRKAKRRAMEAAELAAGVEAAATADAASAPPAASAASPASTTAAPDGRGQPAGHHVPPV